MNIKVAAFTVSEKSSNLIVYITQRDPISQDSSLYSSAFMAGNMLANTVTTV